MPLLLEILLKNMTNKNKLSYYQRNKNSQTTLYLKENLYKELNAEAKLKFLKVNALIISIVSEHLSLERLRKVEAEKSKKERLFLF